MLLLHLQIPLERPHSTAGSEKLLQSPVKLEMSTATLFIVTKAQCERALQFAWFLLRLRRG